MHAMCRCDRDDECVVCLERAVTVCFVPCGHCCVCDDCASEMDRSVSRFEDVACPLCRAPIQVMQHMWKAAAAPKDDVQATLFAMTYPPPKQRRVAWTG